MDWTIKLIVVCTLTHFVSSQDANSEASSKSVDNIARMPSHTVLMYFLEMEITECSYECAKHFQCMTINYNFKQRICELVDSEFDKNEADYETKDWINIGVPKINGNFSEWKIVSGCTVTCGNGTRRLMRECDNPRPTLGGRDCEGEREKDEDCILNECPIDGNWNEWSGFSVMNDTCIGYKSSRNRTCGNPPPSLGGLKCLKFNGERDMVENETLFIKPKRKCVCYESKDDKPGTIDITKSGKIKSLRLTHVSGYLDYRITSAKDTKSFWGLKGYHINREIDTVITRDEKKQIIFPSTDGTTARISNDGAELLIEVNGKDVQVEEGKNLQVWYGQDYRNLHEDNNEGTHCIYVDIEYQ